MKSDIWVVVFAALAGIICILLVGFPRRASAPADPTIPNQPMDISGPVEDTEESTLLQTGSIVESGAVVE